MFFKFDVLVKDLLYLLGVVVAASIGALTVWRSNIRQVNASLESTEMLIDNQKSENSWRANHEEYSQWSKDFRIAVVGLVSIFDEVLNAYYTMDIYKSVYSEIESPQISEKISSSFEIKKDLTLKYINLFNNVRIFYDNEAPEYKDFHDVLIESNKLLSNYNQEVKKSGLTKEEVAGIGPTYLAQWKKTRKKMLSEFNKINQYRREKVFGRV